MIRKLRLILIVMLLVAGCATKSWDTFQQEQEAKYVGRPLANMRAEWGDPITEVHPAEGSSLYEFRYFRTSYECRAQVRAARDETVTSISVSGQNGCLNPPL